MAELFLIGLAIYWLATDTSTALWVIGGAFVLIFICAVYSNRQKGRKKTYRRPAGRSVVRPVPRYSGCGYNSSGARASYASYDDDDDEDEPVRRKGIRIEHPHVIDDPDYECSVCGRRFDRTYGSCPFCGSVFSGKKTDYEEFDFEEDELEAWDEEDGW